MEQPATDTDGQRRFRRVEVLVGGVLLSIGLCWLLYEFSPLGWVLYAIRSGYYTHALRTLEPEYDKLNSALLESLPAYPGATPLPETEARVGPEWNFIPSGGPSAPRDLSLCFKTTDSVEQVIEFYQRELEQNGWVFDKEIERFGVRQYTKGQACFAWASWCTSDVDLKGETGYEVIVSHDPNVLLPFPKIPRIVYWFSGGAQCPY
jgi:hypothetical protein